MYFGYNLISKSENCFEIWYFTWIQLENVWDFYLCKSILYIFSLMWSRLILLILWTLFFFAGAFLWHFWFCESLPWNFLGLSYTFYRLSYTFDFVYPSLGFCLTLLILCTETPIVQHQGCYISALRLLDFRVLGC